MKVRIAFFAVSLTVATTTLFAHPLQHSATDVAGEEIILLQEDFSKFTAGEETSPDATDICSETGVIDAKYFAATGWSGRGVYQAKGSAYFGWYYNYDYGFEDLGYLITPALDASDELTFSFKAKSDLSSGDKVIVEYKWESPDGDGGSISYNEIDITGEWQEYSITFPAHTEHNPYFMWYSYAAPMYIDDVKVSTFKPALAAPTVKNFTNYKGSSFVANWESVEGATSYLLTVYDGDNTPTLDKKEVEGTSHEVTGLDVQKVYYYYVEAKNDQYTSPRSDVATVNALVAPSPGDPTVSASGFSTSWGAVPRANRYDCWTYKEHVAATDEEVVLAESDFSEIKSEGTVSKPIPSSSSSVTIESLPGWVLHSPLYIDGGIGIYNIYSVMGRPTYLESPIYDLSNANGEISIAVSLYTSEDVAIQLLNQEEDGTISLADEYKIAGGSLSGWQAQSISLSKGTAHSFLRIQGTGHDYLFIDDLKVSVNLSANQSILIPIQNTKTESTSINVDADFSTGNRYAFSVRALYEDPTDKSANITSDFSEVIYVEKKSSVSKVSGSEALAFMSNGTLHVVNPNGDSVAVFNANGNLISKSNTATIHLPSKGVYIVVIGTKAFKVLK